MWLTKNKFTYRWNKKSLWYRSPLPLVKNEKWKTNFNLIIFFLHIKSKLWDRKSFLKIRANFHYWLFYLKFKTFYPHKPELLFQHFHSLSPNFDVVTQNLNLKFFFDFFPHYFDLIIGKLRHFPKFWIFNSKFWLLCKSCEFWSQNFEFLANNFGFISKFYLLCLQLWLYYVIIWQYSLKMFNFYSKISTFFPHNLYFFIAKFQLTPKLWPLSHNFDILTSNSVLNDFLSQNLNLLS